MVEGGGGLRFAILKVRAADSWGVRGGGGVQGGGLRGAVSSEMHLDTVVGLYRSRIDW